MSVACSTTQSSSVEREESAHMSQISPAAKNPQSLQERIDCRVSLMARAICSGWSLRARTIQSAIRSAERGPTPGICRSCAIKFRIAAGYSVLLKARSGSRRPIRPLADLLRVRFRQLKKKRLQPAQIKLQWRIIFPLRAPRLLKFSVRFRPAFFSIKNHATPERIPARDVFWLSLRSEPKRLVDFKPIMRIQPVHKVNRARNNDV